MVLICAESGERELILVASMQCGMGGGEEEESLILDFVFPCLECCVSFGESWV